MSLGPRAISAIGSFLPLPAVLCARITHEQKPELPEPYATKSAGNGPHNDEPPEGFLPSVEQGFRVNIFMEDFKVMREVFASGERTRVLGIAFKDDYVYVGNTNGPVRFRYDPKTSKRLGEAETLLKMPGGGAHVTRSVAIST